MNVCFFLFRCKKKIVQVFEGFFGFLGTCAHPLVKISNEDAEGIRSKTEKIIDFTLTENYL